MSSHTFGLLIGGILPAVMFGLSNVFLKAGTQQGVSTSIAIFMIGAAVMVTGIVLFFVLPGREWHGAGFSFLMGIMWSVGVACATVALQRFQIPLSSLVPLFNLNTLISVLLALWIFAEWKQVQVPQLLFGALLIVAGGVMVARA